MYEKKALIVVVCLLFGIGIGVVRSDFILNRMFYNPFRKSEGNSLVFQQTVMALVPTAEFASTSPYSPGAPRHFSKFTQEFYFLKPSFPPDVHQNYMAEGQLRYLFGKADVVFSAAPQGKLVFTQGDYIDGTPLSLSVLDDERYYLAQVALSTPLAEDTPDDIAEDLSSRDRVAMILRTILQTSNRTDDVAIGIAGPDVPITLNWGKRPLRIATYHVLQVLSENQYEANIFIESGLFGEVDIDFKQRMDYYKSNGLQCIGFSVFAKGSDLSEWIEKYSLRLIHVESNEK